MADHTYKFNVTMTCGGCSGAVERVLKKLDGKSALIARIDLSLSHASGVKSFDVSLESQTATVTAADNLDYATVLDKIKKTGKKVNTGEADGQPQLV